jgi:hypothetical protein
VIYVIALAMGSVLLAHSKPPALAEIYVGTDGLVQVLDDLGKDRTIQKEKNQAAVSVPKLSADRQTAGWLTAQENCCLRSDFGPTREAVTRYAFV